MGRPPKQTDAHDGELGKGRELDLDEIGDPGPIEKASDTNFVEEAELEAFMNEKVTIVVSTSSEDGALDVIIPTVNGINQPIIRGKEIRVKRKYVEALARGRTTRYEQRVMDPSRPENIQMIERTSLTYPFSVTHDPNPKGRAWLQAILQQP